MVFSTDVLYPLQTGCALGGAIPGLLHDDDGDNISIRNALYAELTGEYWVWKNYLKAHPKVQYIGFCHYRRFLDLWNKAGGREGFPHLRTFDFFKKNGEHRYTQESVAAAISGYDVVVPGGVRFRHSTGTMRDQYLGYGHCQRDLLVVDAVFGELYPEYLSEYKNYWNGRAGRFCLNFIMRRELFEDYCEWMFGLLKEVEKYTDWGGDDGANRQKTPAYLAERLFNVWLNYQAHSRGARVLERDGILLVPRQGYCKAWLCGFIHRCAALFYRWM